MGVLGGHAPYWNDVRLYVFPVLRKEKAIREERHRELKERFYAQENE